MTNLKFTFKKHGASAYNVFIGTDLIGYVTKQADGFWVVEGSGKTFKTYTRKEGSNILATWFYESQGKEVSVDYLGNFTITDKVVECMMCGNTNPEEVVEMEMFSNEDGEDMVEMVHICSEDMGCNAPVEVDPPVEIVVEQTWEDVVENILKDELGDNYKPHHTKEVIRDINTNKVNPDIERVAIAYARKVKRNLDPQVVCEGCGGVTRESDVNEHKQCSECQALGYDEYVHTEITVDRKGMYHADIYNATKDQFYARFSFTTKKRLIEVLYRKLRKLNEGDLS